MDPLRRLWLFRAPIGAGPEPFGRGEDAYPRGCRHPRCSEAGKSGRVCPGLSPPGIERPQPTAAAAQADTLPGRRGLTRIEVATAAGMWRAISFRRRSGARRAADRVRHRCLTDYARRMVWPEQDPPGTSSRPGGVGRPSGRCSSIGKSAGRGTSKRYCGTPMQWHRVGRAIVPHAAASGSIRKLSAIELQNPIVARMRPEPRYGQRRGSRPNTAWRAQYPNALWTLPRRTSARRTWAQRTSTEQTSTGRTSLERTFAWRTSLERTFAWRTLPERTSTGRTSVERTSAWRTSPERTSAWRTSMGRLSSMRTTGANFSWANLTNAFVGRVRWDRAKMRGRYHGIRGIDSCYGNALFKRAAADQDFLDTLGDCWTTVGACRPLCFLPSVSRRSTELSIAYIQKLWTMVGDAALGSRPSTSPS
jgi:hypothetical protein